MPNILETWQVTLFADDTVLYCSYKCSDVLQQKLNSDLSRVCNWLKVNHLIINIKKPKFILIGSSKRLARLSSSLTVPIGNVPLQEVQTYRYLGVMINNKLAWHGPINYIKSKINEKPGILMRIKDYLHIHSRLLYFLIPIFYLSSIMLISFGGIEEIQPLCQIYKYYIIKQNELF